MTLRNRLAIMAGLLCCAAILLAAQLGMFSNEQRIDITRAWTGERFPDGRPKVSDAVLDRLKDVTAEEAWDTLGEAGYRLQFEGGWKELNQGERLIGRAVTCVFMPRTSGHECGHRRSRKTRGPRGAWAEFLGDRYAHEAGCDGGRSIRKNRWRHDHRRQSRNLDHG